MGMIVLGPGCVKCSKTGKRVQEVIKETGTDATAEKVTDMLQIASYGVFGPPCVSIDGEVKCSGKVPKKADVLSWVKK